MSRNIYEPTTERQVRRNQNDRKVTHQKPHAFRWWVPECELPGVAAEICEGDEPELVNGWAQVNAPLEPFGFRLHADGSLEFKGHLDAAGAASGTVALTLPGANAGEVDFLPAMDQFFLTLITDDGGSSFTTAMVFIDATSGDVTITWPAN